MIECFCSLKKALGSIPGTPEYLKGRRPGTWLFPHLCPVSTVWSQSCRARNSLIFRTKAGRKFPEAIVTWFTTSRAPEKFCCIR